jgi:hypothetical protein
LEYVEARRMWEDVSAWMEMEVGIWTEFDGEEVKGKLVSWRDLRRASSDEEPLEYACRLCEYKTPSLAV